MLASHIGVSLQVLVIPLVTHFPACVPERATGDNPGAWPMLHKEETQVDFPGAPGIQLF